MKQEKKTVKNIGASNIFLIVALFLNKWYQLLLVIVSEHRIIENFDF